MVVSLGNAQIPETERCLIAQAVERQLYGQQELLPPDFTADPGGEIVSGAPGGGTRRMPESDLPGVEVGLDKLILDKNGD